MIRPSGSLPTRWQPAPPPDLGRLTGCQAARGLRARTCARTGRPPELAAWQSAQLDGLLILVACLAACLTVGSLPRSERFRPLHLAAEKAQRGRGPASTAPAEHTAA